MVAKKSIEVLKAKNRHKRKQTYIVVHQTYKTKPIMTVCM